MIRGYWQGVKKLGRAYTLSVAPELNSATKDEGGKSAATINEGERVQQQRTKGAIPSPYLQSAHSFALFHGVDSYTQ